MSDELKPLRDSVAKSFPESVKSGKKIPRGINCPACARPLLELHFDPKIRKEPLNLQCECETERLKETEDIARRNHNEVENERIARTTGAAMRERLHTLDLIPDMNSSRYEIVNYDLDSGNFSAGKIANDFLGRILARGNSYEVPGFGLYGSHGVGKSHLTTAIIKALYRKNILCAQIYEFDIRNALNRIRSNEVAISEGAFMHDLSTVPVLVVEDFMKTRVHNSSGAALEYVHEFLFGVVQKRVAKSLPIVVTSNHSFADLRDVYLKGLEFGPAILDRFAESFGCDERRWVQITAEKSRRLHRD